MNAILKNEFSTHLKVYHILDGIKNRTTLLPHFVLRALVYGLPKLNALKLGKLHAR